MDRKRSHQEKLSDLKVLRLKATEAVDREEFGAARGFLAEMWRIDPSLATARFVIKNHETIHEKIDLAPVRVAFLRSYTVEPAVDLFRAAANVSGFFPVVHISEFNAYSQEIFDKQSSLYAFAPDVTFLAILTRSIAPELWERFTDLSREQVVESVDRVIESFSSLIQTFKARSQSHLVIHTLDFPVMSSHGLLDGMLRPGQKETIRNINEKLSKIAAAHKNVYLLDTNAMIGRFGAVAWEDREKWLTIRLPMVPEALLCMAEEWLWYLHPLTGRVCKALVCDLDNTLWGGVVGEDGFDGIQLGIEYPGAAYQGLQRAILDLHRRGVILAICSKNNEPDAMDVLEKHEGMILKPEHFAAFRINWQDKATNLQEIARELNIGIDSLAFIDDNPHECEWVRTQLPEVTVIELPRQAMKYEGLLRRQPVFERLSLVEEDKIRGRMYVQQRQRQELQQNVDSLEAYCQSLCMVMERVVIGSATIERVAQLTQKTNQFNMTTRRYTVQRIQEMLEAPEWQVYAFRVHDRFGDNGIVGVAIVKFVDTLCEIDTFLLSCRVIGRTVETAMLAAMIADVEQRGMESAVGRFLPTRKNMPAKDFFAGHGFELESETQKESVWSLPVPAPAVQCPSWIAYTDLHQDDRA